MLKIHNLSKVYKEKTVLSVDSINIIQGQTIGLVGNNGAGKSTLLHLILDLIEPTTGEVFSKDQNVAQSEDWKNYTGSFLNESFLIPYLTAYEYFEFIGHLHGLSKSEVHNYILTTIDFFNGEEYIDCNHDPQVADLGLIQDEKQNNNLEEEQDEEEDL